MAKKTNKPKTNKNEKPAEKKYPIKKISKSDLESAYGTLKAVAEKGLPDGVFKENTLKFLERSLDNAVASLK